MSYRDFDFDAEGRDDVIRMEIEYDAYLDAVAKIAAEQESTAAWTQEVSDMYAELDMKDCDGGHDCG